MLWTGTELASGPVNSGFLQVVRQVGRRRWFVFITGQTLLCDYKFLVFQLIAFTDLGYRTIRTANSMSLARVIALLWSGWCQSINYTGTHFIDLA